MNAILLIIGIVYGGCRIVIKSVQQCTYFLFSVNLLLVGVNYRQRTMEFNEQNMFFCCYEIIPILVKEALATILTKKNHVLEIGK
jgi:hypothetical protein